jgi:hypothetical protein
MVYEDMHWSDPTTRDSLDLLINRVPTLRVLAIRPEFAPPWVSHPHVTLLNLNRLPPRRRTEMIMQVTGGKALPGDIADQIVDRTDGVPLFIEELTKAVVESGALTNAGDHYAVAGSVVSLAIPATLHASLLARLDRIAPTRDVAQIAAALGRQFSYELISAVATIPKEQLDDALAQLVRAELMFRRGTPPDAEYTFKHALVQDAAYGMLLRSRRQQLHARIAATLEEQFPEIVVSQPALLARHCAEAGFVKKAAEYWLKAGEQALIRSAMTEAVAQLQKGLDSLARLPDDTWRKRLELNLHIALRPALTAVKGFSATELGDTIARARALAEQLDRPEYLVRLSLAQWAFHLGRSEHRQAQLIAEQIEGIGTSRNDSRTQLRGRRAKGWSRCYVGDFVVARTLLEQSCELGNPTNRAVGAGSEDPYAGLLAQLAGALTYLGYIEQARLRLNVALSEARRLRQAQTLAMVLIYANAIESVTCSPEKQQHAEELLALSTERGSPYFLAWAKAFRGWSLITTRPQVALALLTEGVTAVRVTETVLGLPWGLTMLAEAHGMLHQPAEGLRYVDEAVHIIETTEERVFEATSHRVRGDILNALSDQTAAERSYHQALAVAVRQEAKLLELRAAASLARL